MSYVVLISIVFFHLLYKVGDKFEVAEGSDRYGDASSGPQQSVYLGTVIELQRGLQGDRYVTCGWTRTYNVFLYFIQVFLGKH